MRGGDAHTEALFSDVSWRAVGAAAKGSFLISCDGAVSPRFTISQIARNG
jgi:hypothetical protein